MSDICWWKFQRGKKYIFIFHRKLHKKISYCYLPYFFDGREQKEQKYSKKIWGFNNIFKDNQINNKYSFLFIKTFILRYFFLNLLIIFFPYFPNFFINLLLYFYIIINNINILSYTIFRIFFSFNFIFFLSFIFKF